MSKELEAYREKFPSGSKFRVVCGNDECFWAKKGYEGTVYDLIDDAQDGICIKTKEDVDKGFKSVWVDARRCEPIPEQVFEVNDQGGMKETSGKLRWTLLPLDALKEVVKVLEYGARKYSADNWQKVDKEKYKEALWRHWVAYNQGEKKDPETGLSHLAHLLCDGLFLLWFDLQEDENE
jgi:hypothetical protein